MDDHSILVRALSETRRSPRTSGVGGREGHADGLAADVLQGVGRWDPEAPAVGGVSSALGQHTRRGVAADRAVLRLLPAGPPDVHA